MHGFCACGGGASRRGYIAVAISSVKKIATIKLIGASLSEPHINGKAMRELCIYSGRTFVGHPHAAPYPLYRGCM